VSKITFAERIRKIRDYMTGDEEVPIMYVHAIMAIVGSVSVLMILEFGELPMSNVQHSLLVLIEKACVIVVIAYVVSRLKVFSEVLDGKFTLKNQAILILIFGAISIFGTYSGVDVFGAMANVRDLGPMVAGLIGGPIIGLRCRSHWWIVPFKSGWFHSGTLCNIHYPIWIIGRFGFHYQQASFCGNFLGSIIRSSHGIPAYANNSGNSQTLFPGFSRGGRANRPYDHCQRHRSFHIRFHHL